MSVSPLTPLPGGSFLAPRCPQPGRAFQLGVYSTTVHVWGAHCATDCLYNTPQHRPPSETAKPHIAAMPRSLFTTRSPSSFTTSPSPVRMIAVFVTDNEGPPPPLQILSSCPHPSCSSCFTSLHLLRLLPLPAAPAGLFSYLLPPCTRPFDTHFIFFRPPPNMDPALSSRSLYVNSPPAAPNRVSSLLLPPPIPRPLLASSPNVLGRADIHISTGNQCLPPRTHRLLHLQEEAAPTPALHILGGARLRLLSGLTRGSTSRLPSRRKTRQSPRLSSRYRR